MDRQADGEASLQEQISLISIFDDDQFSDFDIICEDRKWKVHRAILAPQSEYFARCFKSTWKEGNTCELDLSKSDPELVGPMLHFMYGQSLFEWLDYLQPDLDGAWAFEQIYSLFLIADQYAVTRLKNTAVAAMSALAQMSWDQPCFADFCEYLFDDNDHSVCNEPIRKTMTKAIGDHYASFVNDWKFLERTAHIREIVVTMTTIYLQGFAWRELPAGAVTVICSDESCRKRTARHNPHPDPATAGTWTYMNGPWLRKTHCAWCGEKGLSIVREQGTWAPHEGWYTLQCKDEDCDSKGRVWRLLGGPSNEKRQIPSCIWCGFNYDLERVSEEHKSGTGLEVGLSTQDVRTSS